MLTPEQALWIESLSDRAAVVVPYDPRTEELFARVKEKIMRILGKNTLVEHCGASSFGITGQDEIDVSIVVTKDMFAECLPVLERAFGSVRSSYPDRARFEVREDGKKIDLKLVDGGHPNYLSGKRFEEYLRTHPADLERYRVLKEEANGTSVKEYYRRKTEFINEIFANTKEHTAS